MIVGPVEGVPQRTMGGFVLRLGVIVIALAGVMSGVTPGRALAQDAAAGEKTFVVCRACHQIGPTAKNAVGPVLNGVVGRPAGTFPGYTYSAANKNSGLTWDEDTLQKYLANPQSVVKGTKMIFPGIKDPAKVKDVIAFLKSYKADGSRDQ
jgi:cytochrome c